MTKEQLSEIVIESYQQGCKDTLTVFKNIIKNTEEYMNSTGKNICEEIIKNMESKQC
jgi:hypothetical protein